MKQLIFEDHYRGKPRKLLIISPQDGNSYRVFCEADFLGSINAVTDEEGKQTWKTVYDTLKPIAGKIGDCIEASLLKTSTH